MAGLSDSVGTSFAHPHACATCADRKVKCDKRQPCQACVKSHLQCRYRALLPPSQRGRARSIDRNLVQRLKIYEARLRRAGIRFESTAESFSHFDDDENGPDDDQSSSTHPAASGIAGDRHIAVKVDTTDEPIAAKAQHHRWSSHVANRGFLLSEYGGTRYYEQGLVGALGQDYKQESPDAKRPRLSPREPTGLAADPTTSHSLAASVLTGSMGPSDAPFPIVSPGEAVQYWTVFLTNVHPLTKIIHPPKLQHNIIGTGQDQDCFALRYAVFACAVFSMSDGDCQATFGASKRHLLSSFQSASHRLLLAQSFMKADLVAAYLLLLTSMLDTVEATTLWVLMGSVMRMAQIQGLHRDGKSLSLTAFETEMRRRIWWYLLTLDARITELSGTRSSLPRSMDTKLPLNLNDADLDPTALTSPIERDGATEMTFCLMKYEITGFLLDFDPWLNAHTTDRQAGFQLQDLENFLEQRYLRFCDPIIDIQLMAAVTGRSSIGKLKQMARHRIQLEAGTVDRDGTSTPKTYDEQLAIAVRNIDYDCMLHSVKILRGFQWHARSYFPWGAPIIALRILKNYPDWSHDMMTAWMKIEEFHTYHPEFLDSENVIHLVIGRMTLEAWKARLAFLGADASLHPVPNVILNLEATQQACFARQGLGSQPNWSYPTPRFSYSDEMNNCEGLDAFLQASLDCFVY